MAKEPSPFTALDPVGINHQTICAQFTRDRMLLCLSIALHLDHVGATFPAMSKAERAEAAESIREISGVHRELLIAPNCDIDAARARLASSGVTDETAELIFAEYAG